MWQLDGISGHAKVGTQTTNVISFPKTYTLFSSGNLSTDVHTITNDVTHVTVSCTFWFAGSTNLGDGLWWVDGVSSSRQLLPGVYCANGDIGLSTNSTVGNVTFVSFASNGKVTSSAGSANLTAFWDNLLAFTNAGEPSTSATTMVINYSGSNAHWSGIMYAPHAMVQVSGGNNVTQQAALWGQTVHTSGTGWTLDSSTLGGASSTTVHFNLGTLVE